MNDHRYLADIDEAEETHREVTHKWRWITWGVPMTTLTTFAGGFLGGFGGVLNVDTGGLAATLIFASLMTMLMCIVWFGFTAPRTEGRYSFDRKVIHPRDTAARVRKAKRDHLEYAMRSGS